MMLHGISHFRLQALISSMPRAVKQHTFYYDDYIYVNSGRQIPWSFSMIAIDTPRARLPRHAFRAMGGLFFKISSFTSINIFYEIYSMVRHCLTMLEFDGYLLCAEYQNCAPKYSRALVTPLITGSRYALFIYFITLYNCLFS